MNFQDIEMLYINIYLSFVLFNIFSVFNEHYKCDTQLYNTLCFAYNNINNFLFFNSTYKDVPVYEVLKPTVIPYEQRYLEKVRTIPNNYVFSHSETQLMYNKMIELNTKQEELQHKLNHLPDEVDVADLQK